MMLIDNHYYKMKKPWGGRDTEQKVGGKIVGQSDSGVIGRHHQSSFSSATTFFKQRKEHMGEGGIEAGEKHTVVSSRFSHRCNTSVPQVGVNEGR